MRQKKKSNAIKDFNNKAVENGITYAEAQIRETQGMIGRVRAPREEDGPVYMKVSARNALKSVQRKSGRKKTGGS